MQHVALKEVCDVTMGQAPVGTSYNKNGDGYALLAGAGDFGEFKPIPKKFTTSPTRLSQVDDLILCIRATIGDLNWSDKEYCLGRGVAGLRPLPDRIDKKYLWHFINSNKGQLVDKGTGSTFKQISRVHIEEWKIPLPSLPEQKHIALILDKADAIRRKRQQTIQLADQFLRAVFLDMFGDPVTNPKGFPVGTIRNLVNSANYGTSAKASESKGKYPILRMGNITYEGGWNLSSLKYIELNDKDKPKYLAQKGDLLFNRTNSRELVGKTAVYEENKPMAIAGYLIRVRANEKANNYYLSGYLNSKHGKTTLLNMCKSIVGMANINAQELQDIHILIPPKKLQDSYSNIVVSTKERLKHFDTSLEKMNLLFSSISQRAFAGQL